MKRSAVLTLLGLALVSSVQADQSGRVDLSQIDRSIAKEPSYKSEPHYALLVFGPQAAHRSWLVMDGDDLLYLDRNGNGDLTDPEDRIELDTVATKKVRIAEGSGYSGFNVFEIGTIAGVKLRFNFWVRKRDFVPTDEWQRNIMCQREANNWENGTLLRTATDGIQVPDQGRSPKAGPPMVRPTETQNPTVLAAKPADAQITHFAGPLTFGLRLGAFQKLQMWPQSTHFDIQIGTPVLSPRNHTDQLFAPLATSELPAGVHPQATFEFPAKTPDGRPIIQTMEINMRCCGDSFYAQIAVPRDAGEGVAKVSLAYPAEGGRVIRPATFEVPIGGERKSLDRETSYVMFNAAGGSIGLDEALVALRVAGLNVQKVPGPEMTTLRIQADSRPIFIIALNQKAEVREVAAALAESSPFAKALQQCNARFDVFRLPDRSDFKDKELSLIHKILLQETNGVVYTPWDKQLIRAE